MSQHKIRFLSLRIHAKREPEARRHWLSLTSDPALEDMLIEVWNDSSLGEKTEHNLSTKIEEFYKKEDKSVKILPPRRFPGKGTLLSVELGHVGDAGSIVDTEKKETLLEDNHGTITKQTIVRIFYTVAPSDPTTAYLIPEYTTNGNLAQCIRNIMPAVLASYDAHLTHEISSIRSGEDWLQQKAYLKELEVTFTRRIEGVDALGVEGNSAGTFNFSMIPKFKDKNILKDLWHRIFQEQIEPTTVLNFDIPNDVNDDQIEYWVTLSDGRQRKKMQLKNPSGIVLYEIISDNGLPSPKDEEFVELVCEKIRNI